MLFILSKSVLKLKLDSALLLLAFSIAEERRPAANDFEENDHFRVVKLKNAKMRKRENVKMRKRENVKTPQCENFAFQELHEVHNAKAFFVFSRF